ncbi:MAG TPA: hypothetical protein VFA68_12550 [Terriglobales bacterium]|nr:hypothetical protein [Terriglobales bacterium]
MKQAPRWILLLGIGFHSLTSIAQSQGGRGPGKCMGKYDPKNETTLHATIEEVKQMSDKRGWDGTHLMVRTETGLLEVHVGPTDYIASNDFVFATGDTIEVTGSKVTLQGAPALLAREIRKDGKTLTLRDAQGFPKWAAGRRGQA